MLDSDAQDVCSLPDQVASCGWPENCLISQDGPLEIDIRHDFIEDPAQINTVPVLICAMVVLALANAAWIVLR